MQWDWEEMWSAASTGKGGATAATAAVVVIAVASVGCTDGRAQNCATRTASTGAAAADRLAKVVLVHGETTTVTSSISVVTPEKTRISDILAIAAAAG